MRNSRFTEFGREVRKALIDNDMTISDLAKEIDISKSYLFEILAGTRQGSEQKVKIVKVLNMDPNLIDLETEIKYQTNSSA